MRNVLAYACGVFHLEFTGSIILFVQSYVLTNDSVIDDMLTFVEKTVDEAQWNVIGWWYGPPSSNALVSAKYHMVSMRPTIKIERYEIIISCMLIAGLEVSSFSTGLRNVTN